MLGEAQKIGQGVFEKAQQHNYWRVIYIGHKKKKR